MVIIGLLVMIYINLLAIYKVLIEIRNQGKR